MPKVLKIGIPIVAILVILALLLTGCAPSVPLSEYEKLEKEKLELERQQRQLIEERLAKAEEELKQALNWAYLELSIK